MDDGIEFYDGLHSYNYGCYKEDKPNISGWRSLVINIYQYIVVSSFWKASADEVIMALLKSFFFTCTLRTGCITIAVAMITGSIFVCMYPLYDGGLGLVLSSFIYIDCMITVIASNTFMYYGVYMEYLWPKSVFTKFMAAKIFVDLIISVTAALLGKKLIFNIINSIFITLWNIYSFLVVYSYYTMFVRVRRIDISSEPSCSHK